MREERAGGQARPSTREQAIIMEARSRRRRRRPHPDNKGERHPPVRCGVNSLPRFNTPRPIPNWQRNRNASNEQMRKSGEKRTWRENETNCMRGTPHCEISSWLSLHRPLIKQCRIKCCPLSPSAVVLLDAIVRVSIHQQCCGGRNHWVGSDVGRVWIQKH